MSIYRTRSVFNPARTKAALLLGASLAVALTASPAALAQDDGAEADDRIIVTGSRIVRDPNLTAPLPVQSVDADDITLSGDINIVEVVNDLPALLGSTSTVENANTATPGVAGVSALNLRNLGEERTLVLVDGRRHVAGQAGSASVDVNTIPAALVERVEVLTGGASAVYGADAVTGVVNFIMKDDFEGLDARAQFNVSDDGDAEQYYFSATIGENFANDRGNATLSFTYQDSENLTQGDREHTRGDRIGSDWPNPALFVQAADVAEFGLDPLLLGDPIDFYCDPSDTTLGGGMSALCGRIDGAPSRAIMPFPRFNLSSYGSLIGVDFFGAEFLAFYPGDAVADGFDVGADGLIFDLNNNGIEDCVETINGTQLQRFGGFAGCHVTRTPGGPADVFADGLIAGDQNAFGGDGTGSGRDSADYIPTDERYVVNFSTRYDFTPNFTWFIDAKYVDAETVLNNSGGVGAFFDSHVIEWDNPYIPDNLRGPIEEFVAANSGTFTLEDVNILLGRDLTDFVPNILTSERQTVRVVTGFEGQLGDSAFDYEVAYNYGETKADTTQSGNILIDRYYAAADVVLDGSDQPVCRSELDPTAEPLGSFLRSAGPFRGFLTFDPGQGLCEPLNLFGVGAPSQEAIDFVTYTTFRERTIEQTVLSGVITGDTSDFFSLPAGPIGLAFGAEYREEESKFIADPLELPQPDPIGSLDSFTPIFDVSAPTDNVLGEFQVSDVFAETSIPLLQGAPFAEELTVDAAYRFSNYEIGDTSTTADSWNVRGVWAPIPDIRFRGTIGQTVRAPNIVELFSPLQGVTSRPIDPCEADQLDNGTEFRAANCAADGLPPDFVDPLTARISGFSGGNPDLVPETAETYTIGFVAEPRFIPGLSVTVDYYDIEIEDAIDSVGLQEILEACYDSSTFPNQFCGQFTRDRNPGSATPLGLSSFVSSELNFARVETNGFDYQISYAFDLGDVMSSLEPYGSLRLDLIGNHVDTLQRFEDPVDNSIANDLLYEAIIVGEGGQPADSFNIGARWSLDNLSLNWQARYWGKFLESTPRLEIEDADDTLNAWTGEMWRHDFSGIYTFNDRVEFFGGVNNVFEEEPILTDASYPVGLIGREYFLGARVTTGSLFGG